MNLIGDDRMNKENIERVNNIHKNFKLVDGHFDLLMDVDGQRRLGRKKVIETDHLQNFKDGGFKYIVSSLFIDDQYLPEMALRKALDQISAFYEELDESGDKFMLCKSYEDLELADRENKIGILLSFEGVDPLVNDLGLLRAFYELGVRGVGLTWSRRNYAADGCHFSSTIEGTKGGLTDFGVRVVQEAEKLGMFIDVSHLNDEGFWDVMKYTNGPIIASHSNSRFLASIMRNLTDDQLKAIANRNGVAGLNCSSIIVADHSEDATVKKLGDHIDHMVQVAGIEHVGLGFDFCDHIRKYEANLGQTDSSDKSFDVIKNHSHVDELTYELIGRGYTDEDIKCIYSKNFMRVYREVL